MTEKNYEFRRRLNIVHLPDRRDAGARPAKGELPVETGWSIVISRQAAPLVLNVARDLQDYFLASMNVSVLLERVDNIASFAKAGERKIILAVKKELRNFGDKLSVPRSYRIVCSKNGVIVCGFDERDAAQGSYYLEDLMNFQEAPFLKIQDIKREPVFSPRMTHSGWGLDQFPDAHLNAMAHHGFDSILVFARGVDKSSVGHLNFNKLVDRAALHGLDVYFYSYLKSTMHPHHHQYKTLVET